MRTAFITTLFEMAQKDSRIMLVVGDVGFGVVTPFMDHLPAQFVNAGVAEQNMTGVATGMALSGKTVFTYSIANFPILRCLEQVRNDICYHQANVNIVSVGGGMSYGSLGMTHHATEDIAVMRALPNMVVVAPGDPVEAMLATRKVAELSMPCYLRLGRSGEPTVHAPDIDFQLGKAILVREGNDLTFIVTGGLLPEVVAAADLLRERKIMARVLSMHTVKPLDKESVVKASRETPLMITVEEHSVIGGLGGAVAETMMEADLGHIRFRRIGLKDAFAAKVGDQNYLRAEYGLNSQGILKTAEELLKEI